MTAPPALILAAAWSIGVALAAVVPGQPIAGVAAVLGAALAGASAFAFRPVVIGLAIAAAMVGIARVELQPPPALTVPVKQCLGRTAALRGEVVDDPRARGQTLELLVKPSAIEVSGVPAQIGNVVVEVRQPSSAEYGDVVQAYGRLHLPGDVPGFDRRAYLAQRGVRLEMQAQQVNVVGSGSPLLAFPARVRAWYRQSLAALLPSADASLLLGVVLGVKTGIPAQLQKDLIATGLIHLLVLSGLKVAVFARLIAAALGPVLGRFAIWPSLLLVAGYALVGGATPAAVRAAAMGGLVLVARRLGRPTHVWTSLAATAALMLGWHPDLAWDVGFQLSFAGTAAIILLTPLIERWLHFIPTLLREPFAVTCAAQVGTLPLMATDFHLISPVAPLANALTLPLLPALIALGLVLGPLSAIPVAAGMAAMPVAGLLAYIRQVAASLAAVPLAAIPIPSFPQAAAIAYYAAVGAALIAAKRTGRARVVAAATGALLPLAIGGGELVSWNFAASTAAVLSVGDGQAVLLSGPAGTLLIDAGPSPAQLSAQLAERLPPWRHDVDALFITAPTKGHVGGFAGSSYGASYLFIPGTPLSGSVYRSAVWDAVARGARPNRLFGGEKIRIAGFAIDVLAPEQSDPGDETGVGYLALRVTGPSGKSLCDLSDLDVTAQAVAAERLPAAGCTYLLLPGGGKSAPAPELVERAHATELIASVPSGRLSRDLANFVIRRTDQEGTIVLDL